MMQTAPLKNIFFAESSTVKKILLLLTGVVTLAIASQLTLPMQPVPLTFQSATVIFIGMAYGARNGSYVIAAYLFAGLCGLPVFAGLSFGPAPLTGPTAGYLIGFLPAAFISGYLAERGFGRQIITSFIASLIGAAIIFMCGLPILAAFTGWDNAITFGLMPFIISEPIKLAALSLVIPRLWKNN